VLNEDNGGPVKDAITTGLQSLTAGTKSLLSEYNEAFCLLQKRRKIIPVSTQGLYTPPHILVGLWQSPDGVLESIHHFFLGGNPAKC